jgi:hypothetical protein
MTSNRILIQPTHVLFGMSATADRHREDGVDFSYEDDLVMATTSHRIRIGPSRDSAGTGVR